MMKKGTVSLIVGVVAIVIVIIMGLTNYTVGNREIGVDTKYSFDEAVIFVHGTGELVCGQVQSWRDFNESDVVQVTIDNVTYLTHYSNVVLIRHEDNY